MLVLCNGVIVTAFEREEKPLFPNPAQSCTECVGCKSKNSSTSHATGAMSSVFDDGPHETYFVSELVLLFKLIQIVGL